MVELDVHQIELYAGAPHLSVEDAADADVRRIKRQLDERQIAVRCLTQEQGGAVPINLATENEAVRQRSIRAFFRCIELCGLLGVDRMVALPGRGSYDLPPGGQLAPGGGLAGADRPPGGGVRGDGAGGILLLPQHQRGHVGGGGVPA